MHGQSGRADTKENTHTCVVLCAWLLRAVLQGEGRRLGVKRETPARRASTYPFPTTHTHTLHAHAHPKLSITKARGMPEQPCDCGQGRQPGAGMRADRSKQRTVRSYSLGSMSRSRRAAAHPVPSTTSRGLPVRSGMVSLAILTPAAFEYGLSCGVLALGHARASPRSAGSHCRMLWLPLKPCDRGAWLSGAGGAAEGGCAAAHDTGS